MSSVGSQPYSEFSLALHSRLVSEKRLPLKGTIELTRRCNHRCAHCYNNLPVTDRDAQHAELSLGQHHHLLDELADAGTLWLLYTGGEIFVRRDFLDIYTYARRKGFLITLFTNGSCITPHVADTLAEWRPFALEITIYGHTQATFDRVTGAPGSHQRCRRGIELLLERGLRPKLKTMALTMNRHELADMRRFAQSLGLEFTFDAVISPRLDCSHSPLEVRLRPLEVIELEREDERRKGEWQQFCEYHCKPRDGSNNLYGCGGAVHSFAVDPFGRLSLCTFSTTQTYDLRAGSFAEGWQRFLNSVRQQPITRVTKCTRCALQSMCGMCPANAEMENRDPEEPVDFLCHVAHLRAHTLGMEVPPHGECEYCEGGTHHQELLAELESLGFRPGTEEA